MSSERPGTVGELLPPSLPPSFPPPPPEPDVPSISIRPGKWWVPLLLTLAFGYVLWQLRHVLTPFLLAFLLAYALDPAVDFLERLRIPRPVGALLLFGLVGTLAVYGAIYGIEYFSDEFGEASKQVPAQLDTLQRKIEPWLWQHFKFKLPHNWRELYVQYGNQIREHAPGVLGYLGDAVFGTISAVLVFASLLIIPVFAFYLLIDFDRIKERSAGLVPRRWRKPIGETFGEVDRMVAGYVRGQLVAIVILSVLYATGLKLLGLRLAIPIGMLTGGLSFIPYLGSLTGTLVAIVMSLLDWHSGTYVLKVAAVMLGIQIIDGLFITPRIVGSSVGLGVIEVLLSMTACGTLFGFFGILLAVPIGAAVKIVLRRLVLAYKMSDFYRRTR